MAGDGRINPKTGKRYNWVDPRQKEIDDAKLAAEIALLERQKAAIEARDSLLKFTQFTMPDPEDPDNPNRSKYEAARFHQEVAAVLDQLIAGELKFDDGSPCVQLIFCMPPRCGKTELATKRLAAKYLGMHPDHNVAVAGYSDTLAQEFGGDTRAIIGTPQFRLVYPSLRLRRGGNAKDNLETQQGGRAIFVGRGGALTGRGAHCLLIDDLYKDHEEARSQAIRDQAWNWFTKVAMTRRMGKKIVCITMTRWHTDDIIGRLTDPENPCYNEIEAKKWKIIRLPAIAEDDDPLGRQRGEALWPERYDLDFLESQQRLDPLGFAALYQQTPTVADGTLFRRENMQFYGNGTHTPLPDDLRYYCASDHAVGEKQRNDPSCLIKVGVDKQDNIYVLDVIWQRMDSLTAVNHMLTMAGGDKRPLLWWAERGHISKSIGPFLRKMMQETGTYINLVEVTPSADKQTRAQSIAGRVAMGKVYFPKVSWWTEKAVNEMLGFPNGLHDDFVDALAYIGLGLQSQFGPTRAAPKQEVNEHTFAWLKKQEAHRVRLASLRGH